MKPTRREFVQMSAAAGVAAMFLRRGRAHAAFAMSPELMKFKAPLRMFGTDIPLAQPMGKDGYGADYYEIAMRQFTDELHPDFKDRPTTLWGYGNKADSTFRHLGGAIIARSGTPVRVRWSNELPNKHPLPVDMSVVSPYLGVGDPAVNRAAPHLHGGLVPWMSDGGPFSWFSPGGAVKGPSVIPWLPDGTGTLTDDYWYPNNQSARMMWYHDHAVGITRLNAYAGLASGYLLGDAVEDQLMEQLGITADRQVPLVVQDKVFNSDGSLWYPERYDTQFFALDPGAKYPLPSPSLVPEFWGDTMLVNGTAFPFLEVKRGVYRFRILNACNTRVLSLKLYFSLPGAFPNNCEPDLKAMGPEIRVIGSEGGFLDGSLAPRGVIYGQKKGDPGLVLAPGERADLLIDFSAVPAGSTLLLHNDAPVPYPGGTPLADFHPGNLALPVPPKPGYGPNTRTLLQFQVGSATASKLPPGGTWRLPASVAPAVPTAAPCDLALWETIDDYGRLAQNLGTIAAPAFLTDTPSEIVKAGSVEVWRLFNLTADTHPIHFHYFNVRVLSRQAFTLAKGGLPQFIGPAYGPEPVELGWKETVRSNPGECLTLLVDVPPTTGLAPVTIPPSPRLEQEYDKTGGEYVWHCHILEHEEHDMMRPLVVEG